MQFEVNNVTLDKQHDLYSDVVRQVSVTAIGEFRNFSFSVTLPDASEPFVDFDSLTSSQVVEWVEDVLTAEDLSRIESVVSVEPDVSVADTSSRFEVVEVKNE